jgi:predicted aldo/keto reductase-like oxidoreductase
MNYRRFGRTELQMPVLSCGGMRFQFKWEDMPLNEIPEDNQHNLEATIHKALECGINHIETARGYGSSERQLGEILPSLPRESILVQTKIAPADDPTEFVSNFNESLERLKLDHVDLMGIHGINNPETLDQALRRGGCFDAARQLQKEGKIRFIGFSTHADTDIILKAIRHDTDGGFDYVNLHWYYIFQRNWPAIIEARARDMGVFIISPSDKGGKLYSPPDKLVDLCNPLHPMVFNDLFCLSHPEVHTLSIGAARPTDFDLHLETLNLLEHAAETLSPVQARLENEISRLVPEEIVNPFTLGLPHWTETPGEVNIPIILWLRNLTIAYDMLEYGQMRYNLLGNGGHWFPGNNAGDMDEKAIAEKLDNKLPKELIIDVLNEAHELLYKEPVKRESESE